VRLDNDESLGRELRTYLQTEKYVARKNDGTLSNRPSASCGTVPRTTASGGNGLTTLLGEMLAAAEYFVAGQPLKLKASTPMAALDEAMEYLIQNTFSKMSFLKRLSAEPLKEVQAVLRSNDIAKEQLLAPDRREQPGSPRRPPQLPATLLAEESAGRPARHAGEAVRPAALRLARRGSAAAPGPAVVLSEISLMMDSTLLPIDKVYEAITTPAKRRKIVIRKRETSDPKAIQNARSLGKDLSPRWDRTAKTA
jgi:hypothetical protein